MKVFFHTRSPQQRDWHNEEREFDRIPVVGEYVATSSNSPWFRGHADCSASRRSWESA